MRLGSRWSPLPLKNIATVLGFLPWVNWIPGGHSAPWFPIVLAEWGSGSAIVVGIAAVLAILSRRIDRLWRENALSSISSWSESQDRVFGLAAACVSLLL